MVPSVTVITPGHDAAAWRPRHLVNAGLLPARLLAKS